MINFNQASDILINDKVVDRIEINNIIVWDKIIWFDPIQINNNLYIRSAKPQVQIESNINLGYFNKGGDHI